MTVLGNPTAGNTLHFSSVGFNKADLCNILFFLFTIYSNAWIPFLISQLIPQSPRCYLDKLLYAC